jgi:phosphate transport system substrate-binding protein
MIVKHGVISVILLAGFALVILVGCPGQPAPPQTGPVAPVPPPPSTPAAAAGKIHISGAWALYPMVVKWAEVYQKDNPGVRIDVEAGGAGKGAADALGGLVDIGMVSRAIKPEEEQKGGWWIPVVRDAVFPVVNEKNPVLAKLTANGLKKDIFVGMWMTGATTTWGQATGADSQDKINVYTRSDACGAADTWAKYLGGKQEDLKGTGIYGDPGIAEAVRKDVLGIGYNNLNYAYDATTGKPVAGIRVVPIDVNANGKLDANEKFYDTKQAVLQAVQDGRYPAPPARDLNFLCKGAPTGATRAFIQWCLGDGQKYVLETGFIPLTADKLEAALEKAGK